MELVKNDRGVTLVEILAAVVILAIVLGSIMNFFPQLGFLNGQNQEKAQAVSTAKQILIEWQNDNGVHNFLKGSQNATMPVQSLNQPDQNYYYFQTTSGDFDVNIKIAKKPPANFQAGTTSVRFIQVQVKNTQNKVTSETYGYITLD
ncbi:MAG: prepilin-type N-terminal cleavage/methylation domain-containing protein [Bacillota bacterium]|nr:prepilin-type N-terminal cleavage/methylation domain-containing protein [Bacillota bacterium]